MFIPLPILIVGGGIFCLVLWKITKNVSLEEGVAKMAAWAKKTGARQGRPFEGIEVRKNLPSSWAALEGSGNQ